MVRSMTPDTRRDLARQCDDVSRREFDRPISFLSERRQFHGVL
jgi:hypothetical protein